MIDRSQDMVVCLARNRALVMKPISDGIIVNVSLRVQ